MSYKNHLALAHQSYISGDLYSAERALRSAMIHALQSGPRSAPVSDVCQHLAAFLIVTARSHEAETHLDAALAIQQCLFGDSHINTALVLVKLADLYYDNSRYPAAELLFIRSLVIFEQHYGMDNLETSKILVRLGATYHAQGKYDQADFEYKRALKLQSALLDHDDPSVSSLVDRFIALRQMQGRFADAEILAQTFLSGRRHSTSTFKKLNNQYPFF